MVMCFAPDCKHYSEKHGCRFFMFPKDPTEKKKCIALLRRKDRQPSAHSLVCSCHFINKDKSNGPTIFEHNKAKRFSEEASSKTSKSKKLKKQLTCESSMTEDDPKTPTSISRSPIPSTSRDALGILENREIEEENSTAQDDVPVKQLSTTASVDAENYFLRKELQETKEQLNRLSSRFSYEQVKDSDERVQVYTGLPSNEIFMTLFKLLDPCLLKYYQGWVVVNVPKIDQLLLTLMKLKLNLLNEDLAIRFNISSKTVSNIFYTWLYALHEIIYQNFMDKIPSRNKNKLCMPTCFNNFTNSRIILDCTEIYCIQSKNMEKQRLAYSSYKHRNTLKGLIGVAPNGVITYVSKLYPGSVSDKKIVKHCGILDQFVAGDLIIADKGFLISDILPAGVSLNMPPFLTTSQFTYQQVIRTRTIAKARIHVERAIRRLKVYKILSLIPSKLIPHASIVYQVCAALTNLQFPLIREVEELYTDPE